MDGVASAGPAIDDYVFGTTRNVVHPWVSGRGDTTQPANVQPPRPPHVVENEGDEGPSYGPEFAFYDQRSGNPNS